MELVFLLIGIIVGAIVSSLWHRFRKTNGVLKIDHSNPEKDIYRFEIDEIDNIAHKTRIVLRIDNKADFSQNNQGLL